MRWLVLLAACGSDPPAAPDAAIAIDAGPPPGFSATLSVAATHGTLANNFAATITGDLVAIDGNIGTTTLAGAATPTALYNSLAFSGYDIFGSVAVSDHAWWISYPYCMNGMLVDVYAEPVGVGGFSLLPATGTCATMPTTAPTVVDLPAFTIPTPLAYGNASVHGAAIELAQGHGQILIDGAMQPAVVFDTVDCSTTCGTPGWYELHTLVWDGARATFVIVYLKLGSTDSVQLAYGLRLPDLDDPFGSVTIPASWTGTAAAHVRAAHLPPPWAR